MKALVFDTETTGLPEKHASLSDTNKWPHIVQLSYVLYDTENGNIIRCKDSIVNIPSDVEISEISTSIHGIDRKKSDTGLKISDVIADFHTALKECDIIIGHNLQFDKNMITVECHRLHIRQMFNVYGVKKMEYCTMKGNVNRCNILKAKTNGKTYLKYPTLSELHENLFHVKPKNMHNSMIDVLICLKCYEKIKFNRKSGCNTFKMLLTESANNYDEHISHTSEEV